MTVQQSSWKINSNTVTHNDDRVQDLSDELVLRFLRWLDLKSLVRCSQVGIQMVGCSGNKSRVERGKRLFVRWIREIGPGKNEPKPSLAFTVAFETSFWLCDISRLVILVRVGTRLDSWPARRQLSVIGRVRNFGGRINCVTSCCVVTYMTHFVLVVGRHLLGICKG